MKREPEVVAAVVAGLRRRGLAVATEVANLHRSADVAAIDERGRVLIIECKVSNIGQAIRQGMTHKLTADQVFIGVPQKNIRAATFTRIRLAGIGLILIMPDGSLNEIVHADDEWTPWGPANAKLKERILRNTEC